MFKVRTEFAIGGAHGPTVFTVNFHGIGTEIHHRFDTEDHTGFKFGTFAPTGIIWNFRRFMKFDAASMTDEIPDDAEFMPSGTFFDGSTDIPDECTASGSGDTLHQRLLCTVDQAFDFAGKLFESESKCSIPHGTVNSYSDINADERTKS